MLAISKWGWEMVKMWLKFDDGQNCHHGGGGQSMTCDVPPHLSKLRCAVATCDVCAKSNLVKCAMCVCAVHF